LALQVEDLRNPKKLKHRLAGLMLYGILLFVLQRSSRRQANRDMTRPQFLENLRLWFPEVEQLPHQDTLARVLLKSAPEQIEGALVDLVGARHRWAIEEGLLAEKRHGYHYEHCFAEDWNGMRRYHYLMRIGHLINILVWYSSALSAVVRSLGVRGLLEFI